MAQQQQPQQQRKLLEKNDTVLLGGLADFAKQQNQKGKFVDLVYRASHVWSQRHPERARECYADDVKLHLNNQTTTGKLSTTSVLSIFIFFFFFFIIYLFFVCFAGVA